MNQEQLNQSIELKNAQLASRNLWIGELEQWMDSKYLVEACQSFSKLIS